MLTEIEIKRNQGVVRSQEYENMHRLQDQDSLNNYRKGQRAGIDARITISLFSGWS